MYKVRHDDTSKNQEIYFKISKDVEIALVADKTPGKIKYQYKIKLHFPLN